MNNKEFEDKHLERISIEQNIKRLIEIVSEREFQVLYFLYLGYSQEQISKLLEISRLAVRHYIRRIRRKYRRIENESN